jgi:aryl-phospho-beta-D-glucosidase BglC (GH1 family)
MTIGVNLSGYELNVGWSGGYNTAYTMPTTDELDYFKSEGMTLIRLPFAWERLQPTLYGDLDSTQLGQLDQFLAQANARGMKVILDAHGFGRYNGDVIGTDAVPTSAFQDFWTKAAAHFADNPAVYAYNIMNEPHDMGGPGVWAADAQAGVDGIRSVDMNTTVMVEGDGWSTASTWTSFNNDLLINDPANKIVYSAHQYFDESCQGIYSTSGAQQSIDPQIGAELLQNFVGWLQANHVQGFIGEFGAPGNDPQWLPVLANFMAEMNNHGISGTYWAAGPWWDKNYPLSVEPHDGVDAPQMAVLKEYLNGNPPPTLHLSVSEDAYQGDAQFVVSIDGQQIGGVYTATASHAAGEWQDIAITGDFSAHPGQIQISFINDAWDGAPDADRNLYVQSATLNGVTLLGVDATSNTANWSSAAGSNDAAMLYNGTLTFQANTLHLSVAEDAWKGHAQFTVAVDGKQIGGVYTATASHAAGQWQDIAVTGNFSPTPGEIQVNFINDLWGGSTDADRNLFVKSATVGDVTWLAINAASNTATAGLTGNGDAPLYVDGILTMTAPTLHLLVSEDAYQGDAQFTVAVDGAQIGGIHTATASHAAGEWQDIAVTGNFSAHPGQIQISFINDAWGGSAAADRNLYVKSATLNGETWLAVDQASNTASSGLTADSNDAAMQINGTLTFQASTLHLSVAEDAWEGDAQFTVLVDGKQIGGIYTATASHAAGEWQNVAVTGNFSAHPGEIQVNFLNDAWSGSTAADRNLYVKSATVGDITWLATDAASNTATAGLTGNGDAPLYVNGTLTMTAPTLHLLVSEDAYQGNAQFVVSIDGQQVGGIYTATASHAAGEWQDIAVTGNFSAHPGQIQISFINDAWGGAPDADRNLYVKSATLNGDTWLGVDATSNTAAHGDADPHAAALQINGTLTLADVLPIGQAHPDYVHWA